MDNNSINMSVALAAREQSITEALELALDSNENNEELLNELKTAEELLNRLKAVKDAIAQLKD